MYVATVYCTNGLNSLIFLHQQKHIDMFGNYDIMKSEISYVVNIVRPEKTFFGMVIFDTIFWHPPKWKVQVQVEDRCKYMVDVPYIP